MNRSTRYYAAAFSLLALIPRHFIISYLSMKLKVALSKSKSTMTWSTHGLSEYKRIFEDPQQA